MGLSILVAKIAGLTYLSIGVGFLFSRSYYKKSLEKLMDSPGFMLLGGIFSLIIGVMLVEAHNHWVWHWTVLVTIIGWAALLKGVMLLAFPKAMDFFKPLLKVENLNKFFVPVCFVLGAVFTYFGYFAY